MSKEEVIKNFIVNELLTDEAQVNSVTSLFKDQLLDSINLSELMNFLETTYSFKIRPAEVIYENFDTIESMIKYIDKKTETKI